MANVMSDSRWIPTGKCFVCFDSFSAILSYISIINRRIIQHNRGRDYGGANQTSRTPGPWKMVMIIHNFPDNISALRFEWAWQEPKSSRRLKVIPSIQRKKPSESHFTYHFRILTEMINIGPWCRLPLKIRWFEENFITEFPTGRFPAHMQICHGAIRARHVRVGRRRTLLSQAVIDAVNAQKECHLCMQEIANIEQDRVFCVNSKCKLVAHTKCLARICLEPGHYVPIQGVCPLCEKTFLWGNVIRKKKGLKDDEAEDEDDDEFDV